MLKLIFAGLWICLVTAGSAMTASIMLSGADRGEEEFIDGLDYIKTRTLNVPIIDDGAIEGFVVARFVFTVDARTLRRLSVPPEIFVVDEIFRSLYSDRAFDFDNLDRFDFTTMATDATARINARLEAEIVREILVDRFDYFSVADMANQAAAAAAATDGDEAPTDDDHDEAASGH